MNASFFNSGDTQWLVPSRLLVSPLEERLLVSSWPPRLPARAPPPLVASRSLIVTGNTLIPSTRPFDSFWVSHKVKLILGKFHFHFFVKVLSNTFWQIDLLYILILWHQGHLVSYVMWHVHKYQFTPVDVEFGCVFQAWYRGFERDPSVPKVHWAADP